MISIIVAMSKNRVIGKDGNLPWNIPEETKLFKEKTLGGILIMGRKTYESIGRPLPGRTTFIISSSHSLDVPNDVRVFTSLPAAIRTAQNLGKEIFICGGNRAYAEALGIAERMYISVVEGDYEGDTYFPPFDASHWKTEGEQHGKGFVCTTYKRLKNPAGSFK